MPVTPNDLRNYVGLNPDAEEDYESAFNLAVVLVDDVLADAYRPVPDAVRTQIILDTGYAIFKAKDSVSGSQQIVTLDSVQTNRWARDPLTKSYPLIRRYVLPL